MINTAAAGKRRSDRLRHGVEVLRPSAHGNVRLRDFSLSLPMALLRTRETAMRLFRPHLRSFDLTEQQWRVLRALETVEKIEATALTEATCLPAPSLTRILRDLEMRGYIQRRSSPKDLALETERHNGAQDLISTDPQDMRQVR